MSGIVASPSSQVTFITTFSHEFGSHTFLLDDLFEDAPHHILPLVEASVVDEWRTVLVS